MKISQHALLTLSLGGLLLGAVVSRPSLAALPPTGGGGDTTVYLPVIQRQLGGPVLSGCAILPPDNPWNTDISSYPVHPNSANFIADINAGGNTFLHADFGSFSGYGIPYVVVSGTQPFVPINFLEYPDESDPGPYPIPPDAPVEGGSDAHVLVLNSGNCTLYELYHAELAGTPDNAWNAGSGAIWPLNTNNLRPEGWTSADAAGLPILPGLVRYDEVAAGAIRHALRFTVWRTQRGYIHPATHWASDSTDPDRPPMGLRLRLKTDYDFSDAPPQAKVILEALRTYGMIVADNGTSWYISGAPYTGPGAGWDDDDLDYLKGVPGSAFEVVYTGDIITP